MAKLTKLGYPFIGPEGGRLACRHVGAGRMSETRQIIDAISGMLSPPKRAAATASAQPAREDGNDPEPNE